MGAGSSCPAMSSALGSEWPARSARLIRSAASGSCASSVASRRARLRSTHSSGSVPAAPAISSTAYHGAFSIVSTMPARLGAASVRARKRPTDMFMPDCSMM
ncbi:hypothetical protein D3C85_1251680 [compost metagenome]